MRIFDLERKPFTAKPSEIPVGEFHRDSIAALAFTVLPHDKLETYLKSSMWYWLEGHPDAACRDLATAKSMGDVSAYEDAFRSGDRPFSGCRKSSAPVWRGCSRPRA